MKKFLCLLYVLVSFSVVCNAATLKEIKERGVLRHLGVYYANFNTASGDGYDTEMMKMFASYLGVKYQHIPTTFSAVITDLTGIKVKPAGTDVEILGKTEPKGDIIANGLTILPWRQKVVHYSVPTFPTQVWLVSRADAPIKPIIPSGDSDKDIQAVKNLLKNMTVLEKKNTCLDASLYNLTDAGAKVKSFSGGLGELAPAVIQGEADATILDVPDALVALEKWGSEIKVIGPISEFQGMGVGFTKDAVELHKAFENFLSAIKKDGRMYSLITKYYSLAFQFYPNFFSDVKQ